MRGTVGGLIGFALAESVVWFGYWLTGGEFERGARDIGMAYVLAAFFGVMCAVAGIGIAVETEKTKETP